MTNKKLIQVEEWKHSEIFKRRCPAHFCPSRPRFANRPHILGRGRGRGQMYESFMEER